MPSNHLTPTDLAALLAHKAKTGDYAGVKLPARKKRGNEESQMQRALLKWWSTACRQYGVPEILLFSIPNGGGRSGARLGAILKAEGLRKGAPDLMLAWAKEPELLWPKDDEIKKMGNTFVPMTLHPGYHGLFIELKTETGHVLPEQEVFLHQLRAAGYATAVCRSFDEARKTIMEYLA